MVKLTSKEERSAMNISISVLTKPLMLSNYDQIKRLADQIPGRKWSREEIIADRPMKWEYSLSVMDGQNIIALCLLSKKENTRHSHMIIVDEEYRGLGIGREMNRKSALEALESGEDYITTKVAEGLEASLNFQLNLGFSVYGEEYVDEESVNYLLLRAAPKSILNTFDTK